MNVIFLLDNEIVYLSVLSLEYVFETKKKIFVTRLYSAQCVHLFIILNPDRATETRMYKTCTLELTFI